jgi:uncharacterized protein (DUF4415 family)
MSLQEKSIKELEEMPDNEISFKDIPETDLDFWKEAKLVLPAEKKAISLRVDKDVLEWFKARSKGYQTRINAVLRAYMEAHK